MVQCGQCNEWYHVECISKSIKKIAKIDNFVCAVCLETSANEGVELENNPVIGDNNAATPQPTVALNVELPVMLSLQEVKKHALLVIGTAIKKKMKRDNKCKTNIKIEVPLPLTFYTAIFGTPDAIALARDRAALGPYERSEFKRGSYAKVMDETTFLHRNGKTTMNLSYEVYNESNVKQ